MFGLSPISNHIFCKIIFKSNTYPKTAISRKTKKHPDYNWPRNSMGHFHHDLFSFNCFCCPTKQSIFVGQSAKTSRSKAIPGPVRLHVIYECMFPVRMYVHTKMVWLMFCIFPHSKCLSEVFLEVYKNQQYCHSQRENSYWMRGDMLPLLLLLLFILFCSMSNEFPWWHISTPVYTLK